MSGGTRIPDRAGAARPETRPEGQNLRSTVSGKRSSPADKAPARHLSGANTPKSESQVKVPAGGKVAGRSAGSALGKTANKAVPGGNPAKAELGGREGGPAASGSRDVSAQNRLTVHSSRELFMQTAANLGVPRDALSVSLLSFMRFFSLSPNPAVMHSLRREVLSTRKVSSPADSAANAAANGTDEKAALEAEALGAVSALDKGTVLSSEALDRYARFFVPPLHAPCHDERRGEKESARDRDEALGAEKIKALAEGEAEKDGFLKYFNRLPGKNGRYWKVFPFNITVKGTELKVFLRTLNRGLFFPESGEFIFIDIAGPSIQWRCFLENSAGKRRADIRVYPVQSPGNLALLKKDAERFLGGFDEILVRNGEELPSWADELCAESLPFVDEEV